MKPIIIYAVIFILAFILTSFGIIQLNSKFNNIFKFDFTSRSSIVKNAANSNSGDSSNVATSQKEPFEVKKDNNQKSADIKIAKVDTAKTVKDETGKPDESSVANNTKNIENKKSENKETDSVSTPANNNSTSKSSNLNVIPESPKTSNVDSSYILWEKKTAKVYDSMDPKKAAKIIRNYSDNMARDIIYSMKKNKAADVLSELDPAFAARITRMP